MTQKRFFFGKRSSVEEVEEGTTFSPKFDKDGLIPVVTTEADTGTLLMVGFMNEEALGLTIETKEAHYWSRSRNILWKKGQTSGLIQHVEELKVDDDQDALWLRVKVDGSGASCHVGYHSCFYRSLPLGNVANDLVYTESEKTFDPNEVYGDAPNPTQL
jgi:phosphoribosyl-AMP cyclohydrolase